MASDQNHFLNLLSESDATSAGFSLTERNNFAVYQTIKKLSTIDNARSNKLYNLSTHMKAQSRLDETTIKRVLKNLVSAKIIAQTFTLEYKRIEGKNILLTLPVFFANTESEENLPEAIFEAVISGINSVLINYINSLHLPTFKEIWQELDQDLNRDTEEKNVQSSFLNLNKMVQIKSFDIIPSLQMVNDTLKKIKAGLFESDLILNIAGYGLIPIRGQSFLERFETAETHMVDKVIPHYLEEEGLKTTLEEIAQEEAIYYLEENVERTASFSNKKASFIIEKISNLSNKNESQSDETKIPGQLTLQTIIAISNKANQHYAQLWQKNINQKIEEITSPLFEENKHWKSQILFLTKEQESKIQKAVWERIKSDPELIFGEWEKKDTTMVVVIRKDKKLIKKLIHEMIALPSWEYWKILAIRQLIEDHDDYFHTVFKELDFRKDYGRLLRLVYIQHIPFFYRLLFMFGINLFQNKSFQIAKQKIQDKQDILRLKNTERHHKNLRDLEWIRLNKIDKIQNLAKIHRIVDKLDQFYFIRNRVPSIRETKNAFTDLKIENWPEFLKKNGFQIIKSGNFESQQTSILCYPIDTNWRKKRKKLGSWLEKIINAEPELEKKESADITFKRAQRLFKYLQKAKQAKSLSKNQVDSYMMLEQEIKKQKLKELQASALPDPDELDV